MSARRSLAAALLFALSACAAARRPSPPAPPSAPSPRAVVGAAADAGPPPAAHETYPSAPKDTNAIILRRSDCDERCPQYSLGITSNGNVHFFGERNTKKLGYAHASIPVSEVMALYEVMRTNPSGPGVRRQPGAAAFGDFILIVHRGEAVEVRDPAGAIGNRIARTIDLAPWINTNEVKDDEGEAIPQAAVVAMLGPQLAALDRCARSKTEIHLGLSITEDGRAQASSASGTKESDSDCIDEVVKTLRFPLAGAPLAPLTLAIGK